MFRFASWKVGVLLSVITAGICNAQTRFEWPSRQTDVGTYTYLDQCLGAAYRVRDSVEGSGTVLKDTLTLARYGPFHLLDNVVVNSADRCVASIPLSSVTVDNTLLAQKVLLIANRDADVASLYRKRFDAVSTDSQKIDVITSTVLLLAGVTPARLLLADTLLHDLQPYDGQWNKRAKLDVFGKLCRLSDLASNDALVTKYCGGWLSIVDNMPDEEFAQHGPIGIAVNVFRRLVKRSELQDSLEKSGASYVSLVRSIIKSSFRGWEGGGTLGKKVEPIVGDFWFPESARGMNYPRPGKVTLVLSARMAAQVFGGEFPALMRLKRLAVQFPKLDIVTLSGTTGYFGMLSPPEPAAEAELNYRRIVDFYKVPVVMAVTTTPSWRLSDPDRRRIFDPYPHSKTYENMYSNVLIAENNPKNRTGGWANADYSGFLVDADGVIVDFVGMNIEEEKTLTTNIGILLKRAAQ